MLNQLRRPAETCGQSEPGDKIDSSGPTDVSAHVARFNFDAPGARVPFILVLCPRFAEMDTSRQWESLSESPEERMSNELAREIAASRESVLPNQLPEWDFCCAAEKWN